MLPLLPILTASLAIMALAAAVARLSGAIGEIQKRLEVLEAPPVRGPRAPRAAFLSALYAKEEHAGTGLTRVAGGPWMALAGLLAVATVVRSLAAPADNRPVAVVSDSLLDLRQARVESLAVSLTRLRDSLRQAGTTADSSAVRSQPIASAAARRAIPKTAGILPPAPRPPTMAP